MLREFRFAFRALTRAPRIAVLVVASLTIGLAACGGIGSVLIAAVFRPAPGITDPGTLVEVFTTQFNGATFGTSSYPDFLSLQSDRALDALAAAYVAGELNAEIAGEFRSVRVQYVTAGYFSVLAGRPELDTELSHGAAVISGSLTAGRTLPADATTVVEGQRYRIGAAAAPGFRGLHLGDEFDLWLPIPPDVRARPRADRGLTLVGRLRPGVSLDATNAALDAISTRLAERYPDANRGTRSDTNERRRFLAVSYAPLPASSRDRTTVAAIALGVVTVILLAAGAANGASLLLADGLRRRSAVAIQLAVGATTVSILRQFLLEGLIAGLGAGGLGTFGAEWIARLIPSLIPGTEPLIAGRAHAPAAAVMSVGTIYGLGAGLLAGWAATRGSMGLVREHQSRGGVGSSARVVLLACQVGAATVLVLGSVVVVKGWATGLGGGVALDAPRAVVALVKCARPAECSRELLSEASAVADGRPTATTSALPLGRAPEAVFHVVDPRTRRSDSVRAGIAIVSPDYFRATNLPLLAGRRFSADDRSRPERIAIVNEVLALTSFAGGAVNASIDDDAGRAYRIVGVVANEVYRVLQNVPGPRVYFVDGQRSAPNLFLLINTRDESGALAHAVEPTLRETRAGTFLRLLTLDDQLSSVLAADRLARVLVASCGAGALVLSLIGVYGLMLDTVQRRRREIGIWASLGAGPRRIVVALSRHAVLAILVGCVGGTIAVVLLLRLAASAVYGIAGISAAEFVVIFVAVSLTALAAGAPPAAQALRISPSDVLREDR